MQASTISAANTKVEWDFARPLNQAKWLLDRIALFLCSCEKKVIGPHFPFADAIGWSDYSVTQPENVIRVIVCVADKERQPFKPSDSTAMCRLNGPFSCNRSTANSQKLSKLLCYFWLSIDSSWDVVQVSFLVRFDWTKRWTVNDPKRNLTASAICRQLHDFSEFTTEGLRESSWSQKTLDRTVQELSENV